MKGANIISFLVLFILFVIALEFYELEYINLPEALFMLYASGFCLEKLAAMQVSLPTVPCEPIYTSSPGTWFTR